MKTVLVGLVALAVLGLVCQPFAASPPTISITGLVRQPLNLTMEDLEGFDTVKVQLNEVMQDGSFRGVFYYRGVPLRALLELAGIEKEETAFGKKVDLAIRVQGEKGKQVALSWGEVFYRNPGLILVATSAQPIMPEGSCDRCHSLEEYQPRLDQFHRKILFPKLVISNDIYAERCLEGITSIEVLDLRPKMPCQKMDALYSPEFSITGAGLKPKAFSDLSTYPRTQMIVKHLGEGKGYHGVETVQGTTLKALLDTMDVKGDLTQVFFVSAPDGYRSLFSYGEVFLDPAGGRIIIADKVNDEPLKGGGKFFLAPPDDLMADRDVKAVQKIELISLRQSPKLYVIGVGCGDTNLISLEAISHMAKADAFVCPMDIKQRFAKYMGDKPVLFDLYDFAPPILKKKYPELSEEELEKLLQERQTRAAGTIRDTLDQGRQVAILEYGDPTIWSGWRWASDFFDQETIEIIPGLSAFNVSNALIEKRVECNGSVILTTPQGLLANPKMVEALAGNGETLAIFMGFGKLTTLVPMLKEYYPGETFVSLVYKAGYSGSERIVTTNLDGLLQTAEAEPEKLLWMIYMGPCLSPEAKVPCRPQQLDRQQKQS